MSTMPCRVRDVWDRQPDQEPVAPFDYIKCELLADWDTVGIMSKQAVKFDDWLIQALDDGVYTSDGETFQAAVGRAVIRDALDGGLRGLAMVQPLIEQYIMENYAELAELYGRT